MLFSKRIMHWEVPEIAGDLPQNLLAPLAGGHFMPRQSSAMRETIFQSNLRRTNGFGKNKVSWDNRGHGCPPIDALVRRLVLIGIRGKVYGPGRTEMGFGSTCSKE